MLVSIDDRSVDTDKIIVRNADGKSFKIEDDGIHLVITATTKPGSEIDFEVVSDNRVLIRDMVESSS